AYQGINVYRNGYKIYGHGKEDWLKLAEKRLKRSSDNIDNKQTFGYVILCPEKSVYLEEKTNREGFIRNDTSTYFTKIIDAIITQFGQDRKKSISKIKVLVNKKGQAKRPNKFVLDTTTGFIGASGAAATSGTIGNSGSTVTGTTIDTAVGTSSGAATGAVVGTSGGAATGAVIGTSGGAATGAVIGTSGAAATGTVVGTSGGKNIYTKSSTIGYINSNIKNNIQSPKVAALVNEITTINIDRYTLATGFLLRSLTEVIMDEYLRKHLSSLQSHFKDYIINSNNNIKKSFTTNNNNVEKDISIKTKLMDFKRYLASTNTFDSRSLKHLDDLATCIDDINLAMHWTHKTVSTNTLQTNWQNSIFFIEFICKSI
ncbi:hypothetical protein U5N28_19355, partial [Lysinibacillus telephonicus]